MSELGNVETIDKETQRAINTSCRILAIREHSKKQLKQKLAKKGYSLTAITASMAFVLKENWLSEARFCSSFIRSKVSKGQGLVRIEAELQQHGIDSNMIDECLAEENFDWQSLCLTVAMKKLSIQINRENEQTLSRFLAGADWTELQSIKSKLERFLHFRGFTGEQIRIAIRQCLNSRSPIK